MPALKQISFEYARQIAAVKCLQPSKVRGTNTLRFTKGGSEKLQVITWDEFERTGSGRDLAIYESGGRKEPRRKHLRPGGAGGKMGEVAFGAPPMGAPLGGVGRLGGGPVLPRARR